MKIVHTSNNTKDVEAKPSETSQELTPVERYANKQEAEYGGDIMKKKIFKIGDKQLSVS